MHLTDDEVERLVAGGTVDDAERVNVHLAACAACTARVNENRAFEELLADEETWSVVDELETRRGSSPLRALAEQIRAEDAEAEQMLARVLASPYKLIWANLSRRRRFRTGGVVRLLTQAAHAECERDPLHARNLADVAIAIAEALPGELYPAGGVEHLRGVAWKERANACRYLGELNDSLAALDRAERAFRRLLTPALHLAIVAFIRSTVFFKLDRFEEAIALGHHAATEFARLGETLRWAHAQLVVGGALFEAGQFAAAREAFARTQDVTDSLGDVALKARVENNIANCEVELGNIAQATTRFLSVIPLYEQLRLPTEAARARWSLGCLVLRAGNAAEGVRRLRASREETTRLGMSDDAAKITLDLVAGLLALDQTQEIAALLADAVRHFRKAAQSGAIVAATVYLRQAAVAKRLTPRLVDYVRAFIREAERNPALAFVPPAP